MRVTVCGLCQLQNFKDVCRYLGVVYHGTLRRNKLTLHNYVNNVNIRQGSFFVQQQDSIHVAHIT